MNFLEWAEGNKYLYELLCSCWENGITTFASCGGHDKGNDCPYLGVIIDDNSLPFIKRILGELQDMQNITISSGVRHGEQLLADEILRGLCFFAHNYNCCEMFYKMRKGIENNENERGLNQKANRFYDSIKILLETSREKLQEYLNEGMGTGMAFSTKTQEFIDYEKKKKMVRNSKLIRLLRKLLPFKRFDVTEYEKLQQKYGFLQREYSREQKSSKMDEYIIDVQSNDRIKVKDIEPIHMEGVTITKRDDLKKVVEEPCLDACETLYDLNIETYMSSANKKNVGQYGYIDIVLGSLSKENQQILLRMLEGENKDRIVLSRGHGESEPIKIIKIRTLINEDTTVGDVKRAFMDIISTLKIQDVMYGRYSYEELVRIIKAAYGEDIDIDEELIKACGYCYCQDDDVYFESEELLNKHLRYKQRVANLEK